MMEKHDATGITCSTTELPEVAEFLKGNHWRYSDAIIMVCEQGTGRKMSFNFHFCKDYAVFLGVGATKAPVFVDFDGYDAESVAVALDKMLLMAK
nr:MAG TPA: hypothetical protein [Caudoviricetes sp.]